MGGLERTEFTVLLGEAGFYFFKFNSFVKFLFAPPSLLDKQLAPCPVLLLFLLLTSCLRAVLCLHSAASERHCGIVHPAPAACFGSCLLDFHAPSVKWEPREH